MTHYEFDTDTAVTPRGDGRYELTFSSRWGIPGGPPNGGFLMAVAARAMGTEVERSDPASLTCHFVAPGQPGPACVEVERVRTGGRHATASAKVLQDGREIARFLGTFTDLSRASGPTLLTGAPPDLPPIDECTSSPADHDTILGRYSFHIPPEDLGWREGNPKGEGTVRAYVGFHDDRPMDPIALVAVVDAFAPAAFDLGLPPNWVPTIELTAHVRSHPAPGPLRCLVSTRFVTDGYLEEDVEVWDSRDRLVAQSRQLALAPRTA